MIADRIRRHEALLAINHKKYNFNKNKNSTDKGGVNILWPLRLLPAIRRQKHKSKGAHKHVTTTLNVIGRFNLQLWMWLRLTQLSTDKLSNNKLSDNNLAGEVENSFFFPKPITFKVVG